ncbi:Ig-like domain-containing protein [Caproiciproducens sp. R1]|uniref:Ig-like domain-containing protein n=1 Tax=Caproiciproducens sp. R1 TaxID=3435000 RepID=UPI004033F0CD
MKIQKRALSLVLALSMVVTAFSGTAAFAETSDVYVGGTGENHFDTLSEALENVADEGTVYLDSNITVATTVDVTKPVTIDGQGHTITATEDIKASNLSGKNHVLALVDTQDVSILDLRINGSEAAQGGIIAYKTQGICLEDVSVLNCKIGVLVDNEASVTVDGNLELKNNEWGGINVDPKDGDQDKIKLTVENDATIDFESPSDKDTPPIWVDCPNKPATGDEALAAARNFVVLPENWASVYDSEKGDNGQVWFSISSASESTVFPAEEDWEGPAGDPAQPLTAKTEQSFVFPFKTTGGTSLSELQLDIYLGDKAGEGRDAEGKAYNEAVQLNLLADTSVPADFTKDSLNALLGQIPEDKEEEKENTIKLLKAAGAEFDDQGTVTSVEALGENISYEYDEESDTGTWTIKLDTTKLDENKIEFLTTVCAGDEATWGNNNYVSFPEKTKAYCYTITAATPVEEKTITSFDEVDPIEVPYGTEKAKLSLPETLTGHYQDGDTAKDVTVPVTWTCETYDGNTAGEYTFVPTIDLPEGYQLGEDVTAPEVTVSVYPEGIKPVTGILLPTRSLYVGALGATRQWKATFKPSDATNKKVTWESSDPTVATIDQNGLMTYVAYGQTTITVTTEDGGYTASCEVTVQSQEDYDKEVEDAQKSVEALPKASDADVNDSDTADAIKDAVSNVQHYGEDVTKKLDAAAVENLESLLAKLTDGVVTKTVSVDSESIKDSGKKITEQPSVSGLFLASGITGDEREETPVELEMKQIVPTAENALLAFELNLSVDGEETHDLAIPVTVTFKLPDSFTYNSSRTYQIQHINEEEDINELLNLTFNGRYASFTTSSFSTFTLVSAPKNSGSDPDSNHHHSSSGSTSSATPSTPSFISDTTMDFSVNGAYQFKITSTNGAAPSLVAGTPGVFETQLVSTSGSDYYFQLTAVGKPGEQTGIYVNGVKLLVATVGTAASSVKSDTTKPIRVSQGKTYVFKLTADEKPAFVSGNSQVFQVKFVKQSGKDYFYQVTAVGKAGQSAGFYINSDKTPVTVATVA